MEATLSRKERERQMRREAMLQAALAVFAEKGYARATLEEIAQRAEFGKGTLYNYFKDGKEGMLFAIFDDIYGGMVQLVEEAFGANDAPERPIRETMHEFIGASMRFFEERREVFMLVMKEAYRMLLSHDPQRSYYFQMQQHRVVNALIPHLERAMERGEMRAFPPEAVAHTLFGNINGVQMHLCLADGADCSKDAMTPATAADFLTTVLMDGLLVRQESNVTNGKRQNDAYS